MSTHDVDRGGLDIRSDERDGWILTVWGLAPGTRSDDDPSQSVELGLDEQVAWAIAADLLGLTVRELEDLWQHLDGGACEEVVWSQGRGMRS